MILGSENLKSIVDLDKFIERLPVSNIKISGSSPACLKNLDVIQ